MKKNLITLALSILFLNGFSQDSRFIITGKFVPPSKKDKLNEAKIIHDIIPNCPTHWDSIIDFVSINIMAICNGQIRSAESYNKSLTFDQKNILNAADNGTDIVIKIKFRWQDTSFAIGDNGKIQEMNEFKFTVVPQTEAEYPGGFKALTNYLKENIMNKISETYPSKQIPWAMAKFTVNEEGEIVDAKISTPSKDPKIDQLLLDALSKMPKWIPAEDSKGLKVKQEFTFRTINNGC